MFFQGEVLLSPKLEHPRNCIISHIPVTSPGDEGFRDLSQVDPAADNLLDEAMDKDKSDEWFKRKGRSKVTA